MASTIKSNTVTNSTGSTLTLGESGTTVTLACGATQSGFGRTGTVDWCTTVKTSPLTAVSGKGYFINTCGGAVTVTLPASPSAGDIVSLKDYKDTWGTACKAVTLGRNSSKISGNCLDATLDTKGQSITMIYIDGTQGWENIQTDTTVVGNLFITATGGNATVTCGDYKTHIFTGDGPLCVSAVGASAPVNVVDYLVVGGGGAGGCSDGAGGGAGGFRYFTALSPTGSPLSAPAGVTVTATDYTITVGGGAPLNSTPNGQGAQGNTSTFSTISSAGGGGGGSPGNTGGDGGSGGGGGPAAGSGNTPSTSPAQGEDGGDKAAGAGGSGGGAGGAGGNASGPPWTGGAGGIGSNMICGVVGPTAPSYGTPGPAGGRYFSGGGGGYGDNVKGPAGSGGGGEGGQSSPNIVSVAGTVNTGGGGGGGTPSTGNGQAGGSGIVMIRYKYQ
jgi:hypothetical protein